MPEEVPRQTAWRIRHVLWLEFVVIRILIRGNSCQVMARSGPKTLRKKNLLVEFYYQKKNLKY